MATKIEWTDKTWNPIAGCTKCSPGCENCYALDRSWRLAHIGKTEKKYENSIKVENGKLKWTGTINLWEEDLDKPLHWPKPCKIFVCSMADLFHEKVPFEFIDKVISVIAYCRWHVFQTLTKRQNRIREYFLSDYRKRVGKICAQYVKKSFSDCTGYWPEPFLNNFWLGVSISTQKEADEKLPILLQIPAAVRFVSIEPMLEGIDLRTHLLGKCGYYCDDRVGHVDHTDLDWVIVGGESGPKRRECKIEWIDSIVDQCKPASVPVFVKQIHKDGRLVKMPKEYPQDYPKEIDE
jgi:protein gp37